MKCFVAGHKGMVGSSLLRNVPQGIDVLTIDRADLDLEDHKSVRHFLLRETPDAIILAAARVGGILENSKHQFEFLSSNLNLQNSVLRGALDAGVKNLIFLGSSCIYPKFAEQPISEESLLTGTLEPTNEGYAIAKIAGVKMCKALSNEKNLNYFSLMPTNLYGPNDNFDLEKSHVPAALIRKIDEAKASGAKEVTVWGTGTPMREFLHVDDLAEACWYLIDKNLPGELINVGTGEEISIRNFANLIAEIVGYKGEIIFDSTKPDGTPRKLLDVSKIQAIGWKHKITLEDGIRGTYDWYKNSKLEGSLRGI